MVAVLVSGVVSLTLTPAPRCCADLLRKARRAACRGRSARRPAEAPVGGGRRAPGDRAGCSAEPRAAADFDGVAVTYAGRRCPARAGASQVLGVETPRSPTRRTINDLAWLLSDGVAGTKGLLPRLGHAAFCSDAMLIRACMMMMVRGPTSTLTRTRSATAPPAGDV